MRVKVLDKRIAAAVVVERHYLHRKPPISFSFGLFESTGNVVGVVTFGIPASRHMVIGACKDDPGSVVELNRLWVEDGQPKNTASWFVSRALAELPPRIVLSYADTAVGHIGYVYRALNFHYAGWTDMERKTPRFDYIVPGRHSRDAFRKGEVRYTEKVRRKTKIKYWITTGSRRQRKKLELLCGWPKLDWRVIPPPIDCSY